MGSLDHNSTWMLSMSLAMCLMMSLCCSGCICRSFLITTTDSATTNSENTHTQTNKHAPNITRHYLTEVFSHSIAPCCSFTAFDRPISRAFQEDLQEHLHVTKSEAHIFLLLHDKNLIWHRRKLLLMSAKVVLTLWIINGSVGIKIVLLHLLVLHLAIHTVSPSLLDSSCTSPFRQVSLTSPMFVAQRPMAWMLAATKSLSMLLIYVYNTNTENVSLSLFKYTGKYYNTSRELHCYLYS